ncbi:MAG TPA: tRNA lysidine(34) synthetase TilS [Aliidongia sp.]|nr:tRNA lysidine(34) synthetase TilS [Aliidongia sp.]
MNPGIITRAAEPIGDPEFAELMARLGGFELAPILAVAVSGGADSMALALLAERWARTRGGRVTALTVDHRLRPASADEARTVTAWLGARGIGHETLVWAGPHPAGDIQAAAREARYALLGDWCRTQGVLHLLTAHHQDDQAETLLLRLARGSGLTGLAGMAAIVETAHWRLVRPLLDVPAPRLRASLAAQDQDWIEDPSNRDPRFARARLRREHAALAAAGLTAQRLAEACRHLARARAAIEEYAARLLVEAVTPHEAGWAVIDPEPFRRAASEIRLRALASLIAAIGAEPYTPRFERLERLAEAIFGEVAGGGRTLGGCRILRRRGRLLVHREPAATAPPVLLPECGELVWDRRFSVVNRGAPGIEIGLLGGDGVAALHAIAPRAVDPHLPKAVLPSLPALRQDGRLVSIPHLGWHEAGVSIDIEVRWRPARPVCGRGFTVA